MDKNIRIIGLSGSLRQQSYNTGLLRAAVELLPAGATLEIAAWGDLPVYDQDIEAQGEAPAPVQRLRTQLAGADAVLFATPEYNYSIPGGLKNAIDWVSRARPLPFDGKPAAVMGASMGALGTARAQYHLRQVGVFLNLHFVNKPEVMVGAAHTKFDAEGRLTDELARKLIGQLLENLVAAARARGV